MRREHYAIRTENVYVNWIKRFIFFHRKKHPKEMNGLEIEQFPTHLAVAERAAPATQNQALFAILFLYRHVLNQELNDSISGQVTNTNSAVSRHISFYSTRQTGTTSTSLHYLETNELQQIMQPKPVVQGKWY